MKFIKEGKIFYGGTMISSKNKESQAVASLSINLIRKCNP